MKETDRGINYVPQMQKNVLNAQTIGYILPYAELL